MRVKAETAAGDPAVHLGEKQRQLLSFRRRQALRKLGFIVFGYLAPYAHCVEFGMSLDACGLLALQNLKVEIPELVASYVYS